MNSPHLVRLRRLIPIVAVGATLLVPFLADQQANAASTHVTNPFVGATQYLSPDYTAEVTAQANADGGALGTAEAKVATYPTAVWMDKIAAITGDSVHHGLAYHLDNALAQQQGSTPITIEIVIYDLPGRDCAALASNGEIPATADGLTEYETQYIDPIAALMSQAKYANLRIVTIIEPDSLPNIVTNQSKPACATASPFYEAGVEYALNKLHAIPNVYTYIDIAHSAWLGWSSNLGPGAQEFAKVAKATTAGVASVDGFISDTANYTPTTEPFLPDPNLQVGGNPLDSVTFYQYNPMFDEYTYDNAMYTALVGQGFPATIGMLIDTSRNGWGGPSRPTALDSNPTTATAYVAANKIDQRVFRGNWCNQNGAGIGARPTAEPYGASAHIIAFVWIKPPGESDGDYPTATHSHGDPHCDPNGTNTDGNGGTYPTGSIPGYDVPAGQWFAAEFQQLVTNAYPALVAGSGSVTVTNPDSQSGVVGTPTSLQIHAADSASGQTLTYSATGLPAGLSISSTTGLISGTPTAAGSSSVTVTAEDTTNAAGSTTFTWTISSGGGGGATCSATYEISNDWGNGFTANVTVTNTGSVATQTWTVTWTWGGNQQVVNIWNAAGTQSGTAETATSLSYNSVISAGGNTSFGLQASYTGTNAIPTLTCVAS